MAFINGTAAASVEVMISSKRWNDAFSQRRKSSESAAGGPAALFLSLADSFQSSLEDVL